MTDLDDQSADAILASDQPKESANTPDLEAIVARAVSQAVTQVSEANDKRFKGFQSLMDRKLAELGNQFKTAGLSPEEQDQLDADDDEALRRELEIYRLKDQFPKGADVLLKIAKAETLDQQLELIEQALASGDLTKGEAAQAAEAVEAADAAPAGTETPVPEVDRNNPARETQPGLTAALEGQMTDEAADAVLATYGTQRGALRQG